MSSSTGRRLLLLELLCLGVPRTTLSWNPSNVTEFVLQHNKIQTLYVCVSYIIRGDYYTKYWIGTLSCCDPFHKNLWKVVPNGSTF